MEFRDEFEACVGEETFYVNVVGNFFTIDGENEYVIEEFSFLDNNGEELEPSHPAFDELKEQAESRDYDVEIHEADFDADDQYLNKFVE